MKFLRSLVLVTLIFCFAFYGYAEEINFSTMSDKELIDIQGALESEMNSRGIDKNNLMMAGVYVAGTDIKTGEYIFTNVDDVSYFVYGVYKDQNTYEEILKLKNEVEDFTIPLKTIYYDEFSRVVLEEGNILYVVRGMAKVEGQKPDWKP